MTVLIVKQSVVMEILKREIPKLFSEEAHKQFDFENLQLTPREADGDENYDIDEINVEITKIEPGPF